MYKKENVIGRVLVRHRYGCLSTEYVPNLSIREEISLRFQTALKDQIDELDFYVGLLHVDIDVEAVRRHIGDETAEHMQQFCEEHGLLDAPER